MANLGEFQAARRQASGDPDTFTFCDETFTVAADVGAMPLMDFAAAVSGGVPEHEALAAVRALLMGCLADGEWARFHGVCVANRVGVEDLMPIVQAVYGAISGRPTQKPSDSSDGQSSTSASSKGASLELVREFTAVDDLLAAAGS